MMLIEELFGDGRVFLPAISWLLTYLLHSTIFLAAAWLAARWVFADRPGLEEALWKTALVGGLLTASLQAATPWQPGTAQWTLAPAPTGHQVVPVAAALPEPESAAANRAARAGSARRTSTQIAHRSGASRAVPWILLAWLIGALASAMALGRQGWALRRRLKDRVEITDGPVRAMLDELCRGIGDARRVRLTATDRISVPVALGLWRPEICLPHRGLGALSVAEQRSLLAHELAHLVRRDPAWYLISAVIAALGFFQPLNRLAGRRLRRLSEILCDDWAVASTGSAASLARCLTEVAGWAMERPRFFPSPGIAGGVTELGHRIQRLVDGRSGRGAKLPRGGRLLAALAAWVLVGTIAPGWTAGPPASPEGAERPAPPAIGAEEISGDPEPASTVPLPRELKPAPATEPADEASTVRALGGVGAEILESAPSDSPADQEPAPEAEQTPAREDGSEPAAEATEDTEPAAAEPAADPAPDELPEDGSRMDSPPALPAAPPVPVPEAATVPSPAPVAAVADETPAAGEPAEAHYIPPVLENRPVPRFPKMAIRLNKSRATVTLRLKIDETGQVIDAQSVGEKAGFGFDREAIRVARKSTYTPALRGGEPVAAEVTVSIRFERRR